MQEDENRPGVDPVIDVERLMREVRERAARKRAQGVYGGDVARLQLVDLAPVPSAADGTLERLSVTALVAGHRETMISRRRTIGAPLTLLRRVVVKLASPFLADIVKQVNAFHVETVNQFRHVIGDIASAHRRADEIAEHADETAERLAGVESQVEALRRRLHPLAIPVELKGVDADGRPAIRYSGRTAPVGEALYRDFEDVFRESEDVIRDRQQFYVDLLSGQQPVLDVGCGRGELLDLLAEANVAAAGVDVDPAMVARCREKGHRVELAEGVDYLGAQPDASFGVIFSAHLIEHLEYSHLLRFLAVARKKLVAGGLFVAETPNPHSIIAFRSFWLDITHRVPIYPEVAAVLCGLQGFEDVRVVFPNGVGDLDLDRSESGDYAVIATKEARRIGEMVRRP